MCLAKAYLCPVGAAADCGVNGDTNGAVLLMENVTQLEIDGEELTLRSLLGNRESLRGRVTCVDFSAGKLVLQKIAE